MGLMGVMKNSSPGSQLIWGRGSWQLAISQDIWKTKGSWGILPCPSFLGAQAHIKSNTVLRRLRGDHTQQRFSHFLEAALRGLSSKSVPESTQPHTLSSHTAVSGARRFIDLPVLALGPVSSLTIPHRGFTPEASDPCRGCICSSENRSSGLGLSST